MKDLLTAHVILACQEITIKLGYKEFNEIIAIAPSGMAIGQCLGEIIAIPVGAWIPETNAFITSQVIPTKILFVDYTEEFKISEIQSFFSLAYPAMDWSYVKIQPPISSTFNVDIIHCDDIPQHNVQYDEDYHLDSLNGGIE